MILPVQSLVCLAAFGLALPLAISLFPQMSEVSMCLVTAVGYLRGAQQCHCVFAFLDNSPIPIGTPPCLDEVGCCLLHSNKHRFPWQEMVMLVPPVSTLCGLISHSFSMPLTSVWTMWWDVPSKQTEEELSRVCSIQQIHLLQARDGHG